MLDPSTFALDEWHGLCVAHGYDVANERMRKREETRWNKDDYEEASRAVNEMLALHPEGKKLILEQEKGE